jgi:hypothetical protein
MYGIRAIVLYVFTLKVKTTTFVNFFSLLEVDIALPKFWDLFELNRAITTVFIITNVIWTTKELSDNPFDVGPATLFCF